MNVVVSNVAKKSSRDIRFNSLSDISWSQGQIDTSVEQLFKLSLENAELAVGWYFTRKNWKRLGARLTRFSAIVFMLVAGLVPLLGEIWSSDGKPSINPLWASVALVLAAGMVGIDRFFGFSAAYMRYLNAGMKLQRIMQDFSLDWQVRRVALVGAEPTLGQTQEAIDACKRFLAAVDQTIQTETESWIQDFTTALAEIDKNARIQAETTRGGAINLTLTNADQCQNGWQLLVDEGDPEQRTGNTAAIRGLTPGTHAIIARGIISGAQKSVERNVSVNSGVITEIELTLA